MVTANYGTGTIGVLLGDGQGAFPSYTELALPGGSPEALALADFNRDGKLDIAVAVFDVTTAVTVLLGNGDGTFGTPVTFGSGVQGSDSIAVADFNRDGKPDLVLSSIDAATLSVLLGTGDGGFQPAVNVATNIYLWSVVAGDVDGDGKEDLVTTNVGSSTVDVRRGTGDGSFQPALQFPVPAMIRAAVVADVDHDGQLDLAFMTSTFIGGTGADSMGLLTGAPPPRCR